MKKSLKFGLFLAGFLMITTGCNKNYCTDVDIEKMYEFLKFFKDVKCDSVSEIIAKMKGDKEKDMNI